MFIDRGKSITPLDTHHTTELPCGGKGTWPMLLQLHQSPCRGLGACGLQMQGRLGALHCRCGQAFARSSSDPCKVARPTLAPAAPPERSTDAHHARPRRQVTGQEPNCAPPAQQARCPPLPSPSHAGAHVRAQTGARRAPDGGIAPGAGRTDLLTVSVPQMCSETRSVCVR